MLNRTIETLATAHRQLGPLPSDRMGPEQTGAGGTAQEIERQLGTLQGLVGDLLGSAETERDAAVNVCCDAYRRSSDTMADLGIANSVASIGEAGDTYATQLTHLNLTAEALKTRRSNLVVYLAAASLAAQALVAEMAEFDTAVSGADNGHQAFAGAINTYCQEIGGPDLTAGQ